MRRRSSGERESQFVFDYLTQDRNCELALGMPLRSASYNSSQPHPIFAMNLPQGNLRDRIKEQYGKQFARLDDMAMLSIIGRGSAFLPMRGYRRGRANPL